jgi:protein SCO1/2
MTNCFKILQDSILKIKNIELVSFSVMPWVDSTNTLKVYGNGHGVNPQKWHLLTGEKSTIYYLGRASFFADKNNENDSTTFIHTDKMYLIDTQKQIRGVYNATNVEDIGRILADLKILEKEL